MTKILIADEIAHQQNKTNEHSTSKEYGGKSRSKRRKHSTSNQLDPYASLSKQKTTVSARFNNLNRPSQNNSLLQSHLNNINDSKGNQTNSLMSHTQDKFTNSNLLNNSLNNGMGLSYFPNPEQVKNERESLQRIHTFSLKEPNENDSDEQINEFGADLKANTMTNILDPLLKDQPPGGSQRQRNEGVAAKGSSQANKSMDNGEHFSGNRARGISEGSRNSSVTSNRSCSQYVPEKVQIFNK